MSGTLLDRKRSAFTKAVDFGDDFLDALDRDGFTLTSIRDLSECSWLVQAKAPEQIQQRFSTAPELLFVVSDRELFARDIQRAEQEPYRAGLRLDYDLLVAVSPQGTLQERLERFPGRGQRVAWPWDSKGFRPLIEQLDRALPRFDLFDEMDPVRGRAVIGRKEEITELTRRIERGGGIAVTGLRKVGKTTLVRAVTDRLDPFSAVPDPGRLDPSGAAPDPRAESKEGGGWIASWVDLQIVLDSELDTIVAELVAPLRKRALRAGLNHSALPAKPLERLGFLLRWWRERGYPLCLVFDEFDLFFPKGRPIRGLEILMRLFRGIQQSIGGISVVLLGRDPSLMTTPKMGGMTNPVLGWFSEFGVGPLVRDGANELLNKLGRRIGLKVGYETRKLAYEWTGGHPLLHRQFGSATLEVMRERKVLSGMMKIDTDDYCDAGLERFLERQAARDIAREVLDLFRDYYPTAYELFVDLSTEDDIDGVWAIHGRAARETIGRFGLMRAGCDAPELIKFFKWYTRELHAAGLAQAV